MTLLNCGKGLLRLMKGSEFSMDRDRQRCCGKVQGFTLSRICPVVGTAWTTVLSFALAICLAFTSLDTASAGEVLESKTGLSIGHGVSYQHGGKCFVVTAEHVVKKTRFFFRTDPSAKLRQPKVIKRFLKADLLLGEFDSIEGCSERMWSNIKASADALEGLDTNTIIDLGIIGAEGDPAHNKRKIQRKERDLIQLTAPPQGSQSADYRGMSGAGAFSSLSNSVVGLIVELPACDGLLFADRKTDADKRSDLCPQLDEHAPGPILLPVNMLVYFLEPHMQAVGDQQNSPDFGNDDASKLLQIVDPLSNENHSRPDPDEAHGAHRKRERIFNRCDGFAANPADAMRAEGVRGVFHSEIDTVPAIEACRRARDLALRFAPNETRFQYQYARALQAHLLWKANGTDVVDTHPVTSEQVFEELKLAFDEGHWHANVNLEVAIESLPRCADHRRAQCQVEILDRYQEAANAGASYLLVAYRRHIDVLRTEKSAVCASNRNCTGALHDELTRRYDGGDAWAGIALALDLSWSPESSGCIQEDQDVKACHQQALSILTAISDQGSEDVHSEAAANAAWIQVDHGDDGACSATASVDVCRAEAVNVLEELRRDDRLRAFFVRNLAHLYLEEDKASACGSRDDCYWKAFKAFEAAAAEGDDNARQNLAWMQINRQTQRICPNGAVACRTQGIASLKDWKARSLLDPWALRSLAHQFAFNPENADCGDEQACNVAAFDAFSEAGDNGDENAANHVPWMRIERPEIQYCPNGRAVCRQIAKKELEELRAEKSIEAWGIRTLANLFRGYPREMNCGDRDACRDKGYDLYVEAAAGGDQDAQHEIYQHRLFWATRHICPDGPEICRRDTVKELEVLRANEGLAEWPLAFLAETYENELYRNDVKGQPLCVSHEDCLLKALPIYKEAATKGNRFAQRQIWQHHINYGDRAYICPIGSDCRRKALDEMRELAESGTLHDEHLPLLVDSISEHPAEAGCYSEFRCTRLLRRLLDARLDEGNHTAARLVLNSLTGDPEGYLSDGVESCAAMSAYNAQALMSHWQPCMEVLKPLIVSVAEAGELTSSHYIYDVSSMLEVDLAEFLNQQELAYVRGLVQDIWNAVLQAEMPIAKRYRNELLAIASKLSPHTCRTLPMNCETYLRRFGQELAERAAPNIQEQAIALANQFVGQPGSQLTREEASAMSEPLQRNGRARGDYVFYLAELRERSVDQDCYGKAHCIEELIGLAKSILDSNDGYQLASAAGSLTFAASKIGIDKPEVVERLRARARELGYIPSLTSYLKNRVYESDKYINGRIDLETEEGRAIMEDLRDLLQKLSAKKSGIVGNGYEEVLLMAALIAFDPLMPILNPEAALEGFMAHDLSECLEESCDPPLTNQNARNWSSINVERLQKRIGTRVDGKWGDNSDKAYRAYVQSLCPAEDTYWECRQNKVREAAHTLYGALGGQR